MTADAFEQYLPGNSALHRAAPVVKVLGALAFLLCVVLCPNERLTRLVALGALPLACGAVVRVPLRWLLARVALIAPFLLLAAVVLPFVPPPPGDAVYTLPGTHWTVPLSGAALFGAILLKSTLCVVAVALVLASTGFYRVLGALQILRVPPLFVSLLCFMYRYLFLLWDEAARMLRARDARAPRQRTFARLTTAGHLAGALFLRSYERADRVAQAMVSRGFDGTVRLAPQPLGTTSQWLAAAGLTGAAILTVVWT